MKYDGLVSKGTRRDRHGPTHVYQCPDCIGGEVPYETDCNTCPGDGEIQNPDCWCETCSAYSDELERQTRRSA